MHQCWVFARVKEYLTIGKEEGYRTETVRGCREMAIAATKQLPACFKGVHFDAGMRVATGTIIQALPSTDHEDAFETLYLVMTAMKGGASQKAEAG